MTSEEAIEILIEVAVCDRPILSCDFCARYVGMGTDCTYPSDKEIEEAVLLLKGASNDAAISAIRQQEHFRDVTKKVEPLTNAQKIRSMSDEELAEFLWDFNLADVSTGKMGEFGPHMFRYRLKEWLQMPAEEDDHVV